MTTSTQKQPTCEERIEAHMEDRLNDLRILFHGPSVDDLKLVDDGTLDTVIEVMDWEFRYSDTSDYRAPDGEFDMEAWFEDYSDDVRESLQEGFNEYGLAFDYVAAGTFRDQDVGYFQYQISCGGPSEEFRFYCDAQSVLYRIEFWFLDWWDGASRTLHGDNYNLLYDIFEDFRDCGLVDALLEQARD